jgi:methanogenic corrinoid protein MtbC1
MAERRTNMLEKIITAYNEAVFDTDRDRALKVIHDALDKGVSPEDIVFKVVSPAIERMLKSVTEEFDANLAQHFMTAQIASEVTEEMIQKFEKKPSVAGRVVMGTAHGDLHSLGRRIVTGCLKAHLMDITDLGVNVPAERFVDEAVACNAQVIGISAMMVHTARGENGCIKVRHILKEKGLEDKIKIVVGGAPYRFDEGLYRVVQADAWAEDCIAAGKLITDLIKEVQQ